ncbi:MAG: UDP-N-acetylglucosamine 1-carboxyvinyltransferase [bacterium]|nr:UDP-N-acetylglucosamine 1-carboxyvinyltransferase [bacterium]
MREQFVIKGLGGEKTLQGEIAVRGAKNAVLKAMAASILFEDDVHYDDLPDIEDVKRMSELLDGLKKAPVLNQEIAERLRSSVVLTGPTLARFGEVTFPHPGGDVIGSRPIDLFLDGFRKMGATVSVEQGTYHLEARGGLYGAEIFFIVRSHTATETLMMAATLARGATVLKNAALEPEVKHLADFLNSCGAHIEGAGTPTITVKGGSLLRASGRAYRGLPDRIETGSFLILGALAAKNLTITHCNPEHVEILIEMLRSCGVPIETSVDSISIVNNIASNSSFRGVDVRTHEYPGFATDLQSPMAVFLTQASGTSVLFETIFEGRLNYVDELVRMGAHITKWNPFQVEVVGPTPLHGCELESPDVRAGLAFVLAATVAEGTSRIGNVYHIDRGYERIEERLQALGLDIKRETV